MAMILEPLDPGSRSNESGDPVRVPPCTDLRSWRWPFSTSNGTEPAKTQGERSASCRAGEPDQDDQNWPHDWLQLSHELRTPLNAIMGNIELLLDGSAGPLSPPARACIGDIQAASRGLLSQLQPLLLLVQARTSPPISKGPQLDLLALIRQAAIAVSERKGDSRLQDLEVIDHRGADGSPCDSKGAGDDPSGSESAGLMLHGDPVWMGALAAAVVELPQTGPLSIDLEPSGDARLGVILRLSWSDLEPAAVSPLPLALIDAVLALHGARIHSLTSDGLRLDLPGAVLCS